MTDTHCHIDGPEFADDLEEVIQRAKDAGIDRIFVPAINLQDLPHLLDVCDAYPDYLYPMIGLHPEEVREDYQTQLDAIYTTLISRLSSLNPPIAIGEIGLDFYWDETYRTQQLDAFEQQIRWAVDLNLPLMLHCRKAYNEMIDILRRYRDSGLRGVFHCFSASKEIARQLLDFPDFMLGIGGVLTFKNSKLPEVLRETVPLDRIVLETDAPYMAPVPHRGKRNESAFVIEVAKALSGIYGVDLQEISHKTDKNCKIIIQ